MEKTIKYLENGEYHYATVRSVGDLAELKTDSKETLVEAINELWNGGGNADPSKAPKPEGYDQLVQDVADAVKNQQEINQQWTEWQKEDAQLTEERKQAYLQAMKEMQESIDKAKADAAALDKKLQEGVDTLNNKTSKLDEEITKTFSDLDTSIQNMHEQLQKEADRMNQELIDTKSDLTKVRTDLQNAQLDNGRIHDELTNINGKFEHKVWQTDLDPLKEQIDRAETSVQQTKDELLGKASRQDLDTVTNTVSKLDTQLKETAKGVEISVKKDELGGDVARLLNDKTNLLLGTRNFSGEDNWKNRDAVTIEPGYYKGLKSVAVQVTDSSIYQPYHIKANTAYTFSFFGKEDRDNPKATLIIKPIDAPNINIDNAEQPVHITTEWQRFAVTFSADQDCDISIQIIQGPEASNNILHLAGFKLQYGQNNTPWEPNEADVAENIEHTESQFNVYSDQIAGIVKKQEKMGDTERQLDTRITETAEGLKQTSKDLQDANGKITEFKGQLESTARGLKTEYEKYTNDAVGQISDSTLNLIRNSSFQNKDEDFAQWQNVSAKANVRQDENGLRWVELTQSGLTTDNPQGLTSNYFNVKQGKVTVAVDIKAGDKATLDNESVLFLELYNDAKKRVDFRFVTLSELGLSKNLLDDHKVHRGLYRLGIDRNDTKYMTVKAHLMRNGDLYFTNFSARLSSIDDGAYEPNPDDLNQQILKQNTKIEQNAKEVAIKANSVDVTRDIKSAVDNVQVGGVNLVENGDANASNTTPWPNTLCQNHDFYFNGTKKMFNLHTSSTNELISDCVNWFPIEAGQQYTLSFKGFMSWNVSSYDVWLLGRKVGTNGGWTNSFPIIGEQRLSNAHCETITKTFTAPSDWNNFEAYLRFDNNGSSDGNDSVFFFNEVKLEKGNKATSYSPAPGDTSKEIKSAKDAAIQVASDQINIHVNELTTSFDDKLNTRVNEAKTASEKFTSDGIEQTVTKITNVKNDVDRLGDKVDGIQIGGTNLLKNSAGPFQPKSDGSIDNYQWFNSVTINMIQGQQYTVSGVTNGIFSDYHDTSTESDRCVLWLCHYDRGVGQIISSNTTGHGTTFIWNHPTDTYTLRVNTYHPASTNKIKAWNIKIESGNKKTDWAPAPEDTSEEIKSAKEAAIKVSSDKIDLQVQEITGKFNDKLNKSAVEIKSASEKFTTDGIEQTVTKITNVKNDVDRLGDKVDGISVGGTNVLKNTDPDSFSTTESDHTWTLESAGNGHGTIVDLEPNFSAKHGFGVIGNTGGNKDFNQHPMHWNGGKYVFTVYIRLAPETGQTSVTALIRAWNYTKNTESYTRMIAITSKEWHKFSMEIDSSNFYKDDCGFSFGVTGIGSLNFAEPMLVTGTKAMDWSPAPEDISQQITNTNKKIDTQTLDSANIDDLRIQGHYFVKNLTGNPIGGWVYVDVTGNNNDRIRQDVYQDNGGKHMSRRLFGNSWSGWEQGAYISDVNNVKTEVTASVKNLGDRVTTQVNSVETRVNNKVDNLSVGGRNYILNSAKKVFYPVGQDNYDLTWNVSKEAFNINPNKNGQYKTHFSFDMQASSALPTARTWRIYWRADPWTTFGTITYPANTTDVQHYELKITTPVTQPISDEIFIRFMKEDTGKPSYTITNSLLTIGDVFEDYSPNPDDTIEAIKEVNTKWDVANGQIQGKVTATDVNSILNGKGYATQSWAQTMFTMKSDAITLQAVRDNITNGIQNQVNDTRNQVKGLQNQFNTQTGINLLKGTADFSGPWFNKNGKGWSYSGEWQPPTSENKSERNNNVVYQDSGHAWDGLGQTVELDTGEYTFSMWMWPTLSGNESMNIYAGDSQYGGTAKVNYSGYSYSASQPQNRWILVKTYLTVTQGGKLSIRPELNQASGTIHVASYMLQHGHVENPVWAPAPDDLAPKSIISSINITPDQIKIASNKIVIDGNTDIHGTLRVPDVKLAGRNGNVDLSGDGINITKTNGAGINIASNGIQLMANTNGQNEIEGVITTAWSMNNKNQNGIGLVITPEQTLGRPYGGDILTIGEMVAPGTIHAGMVFDATGINPDYKKGFNWFAPHTLNGDGGVLRFPGAQDDLMLYPGNMPESRQSEYSQPTLRLVHGNSQGSAGIQFQWYDIVPFGRITSSMSYVSAVGTDDDGGITVSWYSYGAWYNGRKAPSIVYRGSDGNRGNGGIVFYPYGEVCFWQGDFHSNLRWSGMKNTD